tara:strand:+ start:187 stop:783 length:597 start_codon:yes stop_codon:yes gene_type:complete
MLSNFEAAVEAALIRKEISSKEIADENRSGQRGNNFELKNSNGKVVSRISMARVEQLKDPETLEQAKEAVKPKPVIPKEELEAQALAEREALIEKKKAEEAAFLNTLKEKGIKRWDYKHIRLDYKGRGITQEINLLDIDGERVRGWSDNFSSKEVPSLPEILNKLGDDGWEMISHVVNQDLAANGTTMHYYNFKREKL